MSAHTPDTLERTEEHAMNSLIPVLLPAGSIQNESLADLAHDARNMVTALGLYCDLLEAPGVLSTPFQHYGSELKVVVAASRRLVEKIVTLENPAPTKEAHALNVAVPVSGAAAHLAWNSIPPKPIDNLAAELKANRNLLAALAGPQVIVTVDICEGALAVNLTSEDFTRILINLVKNASEAMPEGGRVHLTLLESFSGPAADPVLILNIEDNGPGFSSEALEHLFEPGYSAKGQSEASSEPWKHEHRGLGLSITRSIVEGAGGHIHAANRDPVGTCFQIELPVRSA